MIEPTVPLPVLPVHCSPLPRVPNTVRCATRKLLQTVSAITSTTSTVVQTCPNQPQRTSDMSVAHMLVVNVGSTSQRLHITSTVTDQPCHQPRVCVCHPRCVHHHYCRSRLHHPQHCRHHCHCHRLALRRRCTTQETNTKARMTISTCGNQMTQLLHPTHHYCQTATRH